MSWDWRGCLWRRGGPTLTNSPSSYHRATASVSSVWTPRPWCRATGAWSMNHEALARRKANLLRIYLATPKDPTDAVTVSRVLLVQLVACRVAFESLAAGVIKTGRALTKPAPAEFAEAQVEQRLAAHLQQLKGLHTLLIGSEIDGTRGEGMAPPPAP